MNFWRAMWNMLEALFRFALECVLGGIVTVTGIMIVLVIVYGFRG